MTEIDKNDHDSDIAYLMDRVLSRLDDIEATQHDTNIELVRIRKALETQNDNA